MMNVLLIYSTVDGHTLEICRRIGDVLQMQNHRVRVVPVAEGGSVDLASFDKYIIGASIRYGKHRPELVEFLRRNGPTLANRPNAFFSVNVVARKPGKNRPETNPYTQKLLKQLAWRPQQLAVFAGKIDYPRYRFFDKQMIRLIMWLTGGPTGPRDVVDFTDWAEVDAFAKVIARL